MLIISRKVGQAIHILPNPALDARTPIGQLFVNGPIEIIVARIRQTDVRIGLHAHPALTILRDELVARTCAAASLPRIVCQNE